LIAFGSSLAADPLPVRRHDMNRWMAVALSLPLLGVASPPTAAPTEVPPDFRVVVQAVHAKRTGELHFEYSVQVRKGSGVCPAFGAGAGQLRVMKGDLIMVSECMPWIQALRSVTYREHWYLEFGSALFPLSGEPVIPPGRYRLQ